VTHALILALAGAALIIAVALAWLWLSPVVPVVTFST
jgi:hypothetical protein